MITIQRIKSEQTKEYKYVEDLFITAFPPEERRDLDKQKVLTDQQPLFYNNIILEEEAPIGFITYWEFPNYYYIEHFAIHPSQRNGGYGQKVLNHLHAQLNLPIVLEVERPINELSSRRIGFYERLGYKLWKQDYSQPPYREGDNFFPMYVMVYGELDEKKDYQRIKDTLYKEVYNIKNEYDLI